MTNKWADVLVGAAFGVFIVLLFWGINATAIRAAAQSAPAVRWLGPPSYSVSYDPTKDGFIMGDPWPKTIMQIDDTVVIGLREDGVVVWRKK